MLRITGLHKRFGEKEVLQGVTLTVPQGSIFGFLGQNGVGKTTTMKAILGLLQVDAGQILVAGEPVSYGNTATNRHIGYLPDVPEFYPFMTAQEYLRFCGKLSGMKEPDLSQRIVQLLRLVGLEKEEHRIRGFSRGMKQRLGIAQALLHRPKLLICDEPTSALDPVGRKEILDILLAVRQETTVLFSTHILADVERICTDVALLHNGRIAMQGTLSRIRQLYPSDTYLVEAERQDDRLALQKEFPALQPKGETALSFRAADHDPAQVLRFISMQGMPLLRWERLEPSLEDVFLEVVEQ